MVYIVANSDYLMETLNLNTHHLKNRKQRVLPRVFTGLSPVMALKSSFRLTLILLPPLSLRPPQGNIDLYFTISHSKMYSPSVLINLLF